MDEFLQGLPKAELHLHIEGTLEPELMFELASRNGVTVPFATVDEVRAAYEFTDLQSFLDIYYAACSVLVTEQDFYDLTAAYLDRAMDQGVRHAEIFFDPQTHTDRGIPFPTVVSGITRALDDHRDRVSSLLIMCFLRHLSAESAMATLAASLPFRERIAAVGLDSGERGNSPVKFAAVFDRARSEGYRVVAHAGEEGPADYVIQALDLLGAERIDHGVRALDDDRLVARLARERIPLTMCPLSNVKLRVFDRLEDHNLAEFLRRDVVVTVNSDDPAYFGGYVGDNYVAVRAALDLSRDEMIRLARNSFQAAFLDDAARRSYLGELDAYVAAHG